MLLLDGDVLVGGLQDRVAFGSRLLAPDRPATIDVRCGEQERWHGTTEHLVTGRASFLVRGNSDQHEVWRRVDLERARRQQIPDIHGFEPMLGQPGVLVEIGGKPMLIELFATSGMLLAAHHGGGREDAAGRSEKPTADWRARQFVTVIDGMRIALSPHSAETVLGAAPGPLELRGTAAGDRLLHASVIN